MRVDIARESTRLRTELEALEPRGVVVAVSIKVSWRRFCTRCGRRLLTAWGIHDDGVVCTDARQCERKAAAGGFVNSAHTKRPPTAARAE
jgi:hypothetical protein